MEEGLEKGEEEDKGKYEGKGKVRDLHAEMQSGGGG